MPDSDVVHVRRATLADVTDIVRLARQVHAVHVAGRPDIFKAGGGEASDTIEQRLSDDDHFYWVAAAGDIVIGYAYARLIEERESLFRLRALTLVLDQMGVDDHHRSHGIGQQLWAAVRDTAASEAVDRVIVNVWSFNGDARRFYERLGFASYHERLSFEL